MTVAVGEIIRLRMRERLVPDTLLAGRGESIFGVSPGHHEELNALAQSMLRCWLREDFRGLDAGLRRVLRLSAELGLPLLGRVSLDVRHCLHLEEATALSATWARLVRLLEQAAARGL